jgi:hypothetical protein
MTPGPFKMKALVIYESFLFRLIQIKVYFIYILSGVNSQVIGIQQQQLNLKSMRCINLMYQSTIGDSFLIYVEKLFKILQSSVR